MKVRMVMLASLLFVAASGWHEVQARKAMYAPEVGGEWKRVEVGATHVETKGLDSTVSAATLRVEKVKHEQVVLPEYWGAGSSRPSTVVAGLTIYFGSDSVRVPWSGFGRLSEAHELRVDGTGLGSAWVLMRGSGSGGAYTATWYVKDGRLIHWRVEDDKLGPERFEDASWPPVLGK